MVVLQDQETAYRTEFFRADEDGNGTMDVNELVEVMKNLGKSFLKPDKLEATFKKFDTSGDGNIDAQEFKAMMEQVMKHLLGSTFPSNRQRPFFTEQLERTFASVDGSGDNNIDYDEFKAKTLELESFVAGQILRAFDVDESGAIEFEEFKIMMENFVRVCGVRRGD
jgi:Ca2+-binding EF-hand superfamily protein